ncbi:MAG: LPS export ABC transporter periplasmic protein LptC, partial [Bdellovibrionaceae bacterium]|nr:LPS export ABC transporter periplasmic protein LptC [Pseudobdellovibrionaceae bacterium]
MIQRLKNLQINKSVFFISLVGVIIFIEILIAAPQILEKEEIDSAEPSSALKEAADTSAPKAIEQKMSGVHFVENGKNEKGWELFAVEANGSTEGQWVLKTVKVQFYTNNQQSYTVTGDHGEVDSITKDIIITGHVVTTSSNGYSFKTNTIRYMAKQKLMTSVDQVQMNGPADKSGPGFNLTGEKLLVDMAKGKMSILDQVVANKIINEKPFKLTSVRADFSNKNQEATFSGHVQMKLGTTEALAPFALFQYSNQRKTLEKIVMNND